MGRLFLTSIVWGCGQGGWILGNTLPANLAPMASCRFSERPSLKNTVESSRGRPDNTPASAWTFLYVHAHLHTARVLAFYVNISTTSNTEIPSLMLLQYFSYVSICHKLLNMVVNPYSSMWGNCASKWTVVHAHTQSNSFTVSFKVTGA